MSSSIEAIPLNALGFSTRVKFAFGVLFKTIVLYGFFLMISIIKDVFFETYDSDGLLYFGISILILCTIYFIYYIASESKGMFKNSIAGFFMSIIGMIFAMLFPVIGIVLAILGIFSMIRQIISFVKLLPLLLLGALTSILLLWHNIIFTGYYGSMPFLDIFDLSIDINVLSIPYFILTFFISLNLSFKYPLKYALFRVSIIFLSIPLMIIIFYIVKTMIARLIFNPSESQQARIVNKKIFVQPYYRANGTLVSGYWRGI